MSSHPRQRNYFPADAVEFAEFAPTAPPFIKPVRRSGRKLQGLKYERKAHEYLEARYGSLFLRGPWLRFRLAGDPRLQWCQPDGIYFDLPRGQITIVEIKYNHTADAWFQLTSLYLPVLLRLFPEELWKFACIEMVKWYDCATTVPKPVKLRPSVCAARPGEFGVYIWRPGDD